MSETTKRALITDDDLDCLDTLDADGAMNVSDLYVLAPRQRARWVAEALEELAGDMRSELLTAHDLRAHAAEYRAGTR